MIQIILTWSGNWDLIEANYSMKASVTEMVDNTYLVLLDKPDDFDDLEQDMEAQSDVFVISTHNMDGTQYSWGNGHRRNHTITKYKGKLNDIKKYDEDGNVTSSRRPTTTEAENTQVNLMYGHPQREI